MTRTVLRFSIVGPGRVGSSIARALQQSGGRCSTIIYKDESRRELTRLRLAFPESHILDQLSLSASDEPTTISHYLPPLDSVNRSHTASRVITRSHDTVAQPSISHQAGFQKGKLRTGIALRDCDVIFIAVEDDKIPDVVSRLSALHGIDWKGKVVFHTSGVVRVKVLSALKEQGATVGALHPIAAFASRYDAEAAMGIYYDFFGANGALVAARKVTGSLHSKLLILKSERERSLLHVACATASNSTVIALRSAEQLISDFINAKDARSLIERLLSSTVRNLTDRKNLDSLTGPLKRGDAGVIAEHIKALESDRYLLRFYKAWSLLGIKILLEDERDRFQRARLKKIKKILEGK